MLLQNNLLVSFWLVDLQRHFRRANRNSFVGDSLAVSDSSFPPVNRNRTFPWSLSSALVISHLSSKHTADTKKTLENSPRHTREKMKCERSRDATINTEHEQLTRRKKSKIVSAQPAPATTEIPLSTHTRLHIGGNSRSLFCIAIAIAATYWRERDRMEWKIERLT